MAHLPSMRCLRSIDFGLRIHYITETIVSSVSTNHQPLATVRLVHSDDEKETNVVSTTSQHTEMIEYIIERLLQTSEIIGLLAITNHDAARVETSFPARNDCRYRRIIVTPVG